MLSWPIVGLDGILAPDIQKENKVGKIYNEFAHQCRPQYNFEGKKYT